MDLTRSSEGKGRNAGMSEREETRDEEMHREMGENSEDE